MSIDELPDQFEQFVSRARVALDQQITKAKSVLAAVNAEKTAAQNAVTDLQAQRKATEEQLEQSSRVATLSGLDWRRSRHRESSH